MTTAYARAADLLDGGTSSPDLVAGVRVEAYSRGRFITVTGRRFGSAPSRLGPIRMTAS